MELSETNLRAWWHDPEEIKPEHYMAERALLYRDGTVSLNDEEIDALIAYLMDLR